MLNFLLLMVSFAPLLYGANLLVDSASSLAKKLNIPNIVIGLTVVAFGTSSPELVVNVFASATGNSTITIGNVIGSNILNVLVILGISAIIYPLTVKSATTWIEIPLSLMAAAAVLVVANDPLIDQAAAPVIGRVDGIMLLLLFIVFIVYNFHSMRAGEYVEEIPTKEYSVKKSLLLLAAGLALLIVSGRLIVFFATRLAVEIGLSERIIALTVVSIGTSLPELATSAVAASKKHVDIAIGNIVGSNIFNIFLVLGVSAVINPITVPAASNLDMLVNLGAGLLLFLFIFTGKGRQLERWEGIILVSLYAGYMTAVLLI